jgi:hypothetical protein
MPNWDEIEEEIAQHLEDRYAELRARGLSDAAARRDASRQIKHLTRELDAVARPAPLVEHHGAMTMIGLIWQDARYALRSLTKDAAFTDRRRHARARHWRHHRDLQRARRRVVASAAIP